MKEKYYKEQRERMREFIRKGVRGANELRRLGIPQCVIGAHWFNDLRNMNF